LIFAVTETVTWIRVEKPAFDLIGVVLGSLALAAAIAGVTLVLGLTFALVLIRRDRHPGPPAQGVLSLHLDRPAPLS
jgi:ABC-type spermidine/putrescine transport system permease subunit I